MVGGVGGGISFSLKNISICSVCLPGPRTLLDDNWMGDLLVSILQPTN